MADLFGMVTVSNLVIHTDKVNACIVKFTHQIILGASRVFINVFEICQNNADFAFGKRLSLKWCCSRCRGVRRRGGIGGGKSGGMSRCRSRRIGGGLSRGCGGGTAGKSSYLNHITSYPIIGCQQYHAKNHHKNQSRYQQKISLIATLFLSLLLNFALPYFT